MKRKKQIAAYRHVAYNEPAQTPDTRPGEYYVTVVDGKRTNFLLGPFTNDHKAALEHVDAVRQKAEELDPRAVFYSYGTARLPVDDSVPIRAGLLNRYFDLPTRRVHDEG